MNTLNGCNVNLEASGIHWRIRMLEDKREQLLTDTFTDTSSLLYSIGNFLFELLVPGSQVFTGMPCIEVQCVGYWLSKCSLKLIALHGQDVIHVGKIQWTFFSRLTRFAACHRRLSCRPPF